MSAADDKIRLIAALDRHAALALAVSGGVDSMVLAHVAHRFGRAEIRVFHAVSPAVPAEATARVRAHAAREGWNATILDAGELADPDYVANPVNRCYFCKSNLYARIRAVTPVQIASGANLDDLGDYRPGLDAARTRGVVHPFIEAGIGKAAIYALARDLGLADLSALPAQPCLASRIETGIAVEAATLAFIAAAERDLVRLLPRAEALRCRVTRDGVVVEAAPMPDADTLAAIVDRIGARCAAAGRAFAGVRPYRRGSAFLRDAS